MSVVAFASALVTAVVTLAQPVAPDAPDLRHLRWVRGSVIALGPEAITLRLRDRDITLVRDANTEIVAADPGTAVAIGATVEGHYTERQGVRRAAVLVQEPEPGEVSKRPQTSARGQMLGVKWGALQITSGGKTRRGLAFEKKSRLVDRDGHLLATGKDAILKMLAPDAELLVKYNNEGGLSVEGMDLAGSDNIQEIRLLR